MAKVNDYMAGREDGLQLAFSIVKERGIEGLEEEIKFRNATGIHTMLAKKDLDKATRKIKEMTLDTFTILDDMASWQDYIDTIKAETGIELRLRRND